MKRGIGGDAESSLFGVQQVKRPTGSCGAHTCEERTLRKLMEDGRLGREGISDTGTKDLLSSMQFRGRRLCTYSHIL